jgi:hypothetical protein
MQANHSLVACAGDQNDDEEAADMTQVPQGPTLENMQALAEVVYTTLMYQGERRPGAYVSTLCQLLQKNAKELAAPAEWYAVQNGDRPSPEAPPDSMKAKERAEVVQGLAAVLQVTTELANRLGIHMAEVVTFATVDYKHCLEHGHPAPPIEPVGTAADTVGG